MGVADCVGHRERDKRGPGLPGPDNGWGLRRSLFHTGSPGLVWVWITVDLSFPNASFVFYVCLSLSLIRGYYIERATAQGLETSASYFWLG